MDAVATENGAIGERIKALRRSMHLSLRELSERSGVSAPMLSQVERGDTSPTLTVAGKIATGLELTLSQLLRLDEGRHVVVVPKGSGRARERGGHRTEELTPALPGQRADVSRHTLDAGRLDRRSVRSADARGGRPRNRARPRGQAHPRRRRRGPRALSRAMPSPSTPTCHTTSKTATSSPCEFVAVVAAGLRRS